MRHVSLVVSLVAVVTLMTAACAPLSGRTGTSPSSGRPLGLDLYRPEPAENPSVPSTVALGRRLFHERRLSRDGSFSCADCHQPERAFTDGRIQSVGVQGRLGSRNVPTLVNRAWGETFFWDGRIATLEEQVLQPIMATVEMDLAIDEAVERLRRERAYRTAFRETFGRDVDASDLARALAAYVRTIQSGASPYDRYVWGESDALSPDARVGLRLFSGRANCTACHTGPNLTDEAFHNTGVFWGQEPYDPGRFTVTEKTEDIGKFKTPTLREIGRTAPYMHDGSLATLEDVVDFYANGGRPNPFLDPALHPLRLTEDERAALAALLRSLTGVVSDGL